jgi:hypothetical protein
MHHHYAVSFLTAASATFLVTIGDSPPAPGARKFSSDIPYSFAASRGGRRKGRGQPPVKAVDPLVLELSDKYPSKIYASHFTFPYNG